MVAPGSEARADDGTTHASPSADRIRSAAAEYDAGRRAFMEGSFDSAATHFENAWHDAPRAEALRNAIRARREAKQYARAATLAALAERMYGDDAPTMVVVHDTLQASSPKLHRVSLTCSVECGVAADGRAVSLEDAKRFTLYLDPGTHGLVVTWSGDRSKEVSIEARAGGSEDLTLAPPEPKPAPVVTPVAATPAPPPPPAAQKPFGPVIFFVGAGLTVAGIAATVVSGIDAENNPGTDAVKRDCVGLGESCPTYQRGRSAQLRTNVLLGVTAGLAVVTGVVGVFFTQWSHPATASTASTQGPLREGLAPTLELGPHGGSAGLRGTF